MESDNDISHDVITAFILELQQKVDDLTIQNQQLHAIIESKNINIHALELSLLNIQDPVTSNVPDETPSEVRKIEKILMKRGKYVHPRIAQRIHQRIHQSRTNVTGSDF